MNRYIFINENQIVTGIRYGQSIADGEVASEQGEIGQRYVDGNFVDVPVEPQPSVETMEQKVARLEQLLQEQNLVQMEVLATIFEELVGGA